MQSGIKDTRRWEIEFATKARWTNPLMGWTSTDDPMGNVSLKFESKEQAMEFAKKQGWKYDVIEPIEAQDLAGEKSYSYNFLPENVTKRLLQQGTKASVHFKHPTGRKATFVKTLKYHGDGSVAQHGGDV